MIKVEDILKKTVLVAGVSILALSGTACAASSASSSPSIHNAYQDGQEAPVVEEKAKKKEKNKNKQKNKEKHQIRVISNGHKLVESKETKDGNVLIIDDGDGNKTEILINGDTIELDTDKVFELKDGKKIVLNGKTIDENGFIFNSSGDRVPIISISRANEMALREVTRELKSIEKQIKNADSEFEREVLEQARDGLIVAIEDMKERRNDIVEFRADIFEWEEDRKRSIKDALKELKSNEKELGRARIIMLEELEEARHDIEEAFQDMEFDFEFDFDFDDVEVHIDESDLKDIEKTRLKALKRARKELDKLEKRHLRSLKHSEERLKRQQERLQHELARSKERQEALRLEREELEKRIAEMEKAEQERKDNQK